MSLEWFHYAGRPITLNPSRRYTLDRADKPSGLWISPATEDGWRAWREGKECGIPETEYVYRVDLSPDANLLVVKPHEISRLHQRFPRRRMDKIMPFYPYDEDHPSWETITEQFDGVLIPRYSWDHRLSVNWYYGWDCASGCIWNLRAISGFDCTGILHAKAKEAVA